MLRDLIRCCGSVGEAITALSRIPVHMACNIAVLDARGEACTVQIAPDRPPCIIEAAVATNHQGLGDWPRYALPPWSAERERLLLERIADSHETAESLGERFLHPRSTCATSIEARARSPRVSSTFLACGNRVVRWIAGQRPGRQEPAVAIISIATPGCDVSLILMDPEGGPRGHRRGRHNTPEKQGPRK